MLERPCDSLLYVDEMTGAVERHATSRRLPRNVDEKEESDDDTRVRGAVTPPPPYVERLPRFVSLKRAAEACGNDDSDFYLQKAMMALIKAQNSKSLRQADVSKFVGGGEHSSAPVSTVTHVLLLLFLFPSGNVQLTLHPYYPHIITINHT